MPVEHTAGYLSNQILIVTLFSLFLQKRFPLNGHNGFPLPQTGHHLRANRWVHHPSPLPHTHHPNDDIMKDYFRSTINMRIVNKFLLSSIRRSYNCGSGWRLVCAALSNRIDVYCTARYLVLIYFMLNWKRWTETDVFILNHDLIRTNKWTALTSSWANCYGLPLWWDVAETSSVIKKANLRWFLGNNFSLCSSDFQQIKLSTLDGLFVIDVTGLFQHISVSYSAFLWVGVEEPFACLLS